VKFSVVIPFFDELHLLRTAVSSCVRANIPDLEILVVNDNPEQVSAELLAALELGPGVKVIMHDANKGLQAARNTGIRSACGEYVLFLDSDDFFFPSALRDALDFVVAGAADITHFNTYVARPYARSIKTFRWDKKYYQQSGHFYGDEVPVAGMFSLSTWSAVYRTDFLRSNSLYGDEEQRKYEDRLFVVQTMLAANSLSIFPRSIRVWRKRSQSITTMANDLYALQLKAKSFQKVLAAIAGCGRPGNVKREMLANDIGLMFSQIFSGGTDEAYRDIYFMDDSEEIVRLREGLADTLASHAPGAWRDGAWGSALVRLREIRPDIASRLSKSRFHDLVSAVMRSDAAAVRSIVAEVSSATSAVDIDCSRRLSAVELERDGAIDYVVHVGMHKTGTTSMQTMFDANRELLISHGLLFPETGFGGSAGFRSVKAGGIPGHDALWRALREDAVDELRRLHEEIRQSRCSQVLISAENMSSRLYGTSDGEGFNALSEALQRLPSKRSLTFLVYFRNPVTWMDSYYRELLAGGFELAFSVGGADEFAMDNVAFVDYASLAGGLSRVSGRDVLMGDFDGDKHGNLHHAFLAKIDARFAGMAGQLDVSKGVTYPSICNAQMKVLQMIKCFAREKNVYKALAREFLDRTAATHDRRIAFNSLVQRKLSRRFLVSSGEWARAAGMEQMVELADANGSGELESPSAVPAHFVEQMWDIVNQPSLRDDRFVSSDVLTRHLECEFVIRQIGLKRGLFPTLEAFHATKRWLKALKHAVRR